MTKIKVYFLLLFRGLHIGIISPFERYKDCNYRFTTLQMNLGLLSNIELMEDKFSMTDDWRGRLTIEEIEETGQQYMWYKM